MAFDAFVIFDFRTFIRTAHGALGERGAGFAAAWLQKLFADTWLLTSAGRYQPFEAVAAASLASVAERLEPALSTAFRTSLLESFSRLDVWPDVLPALTRLRDAGMQTCILTNLSEELLASILSRAKLGSMFDAVLSTDRVRQYKPARAAYELAPRTLGLPTGDIGFAAFGGWDAVGATWFGYRTAWVNRSGAPREWLDVAPEITSPGIEAVLELAGIG
jgi:2-haloacid dehalogenase